MIGEFTIQSHAGKPIPISFKPIDEVGANERASFFTKRSIKKESKIRALYRILSMIDLTTLEGADTPGKIHQLCQKARFPVTPGIYDQLSNHPEYQPNPQVAAVCVYPSMVSQAKKSLSGSTINIASVATAFPSGQLPIKLKIKEVKLAVDSGANEIDMVINRGSFLSGNYQNVFDEILQIKEACQQAHLKVILETGELVTYDRIYFASQLAMLAGADFIKTSTGKINPAATLPVTLVMLNAIYDYYQESGRRVGMKPAGGIRNTKQAIHYLCMVKETLGPDWLHPDLFRFGASTLLNDVLKQLFKQMTGRYFYDKAFSLD